MDLGLKARGGARGRGSARGARGKGLRRKRDESTLEPPELEDVGWESPAASTDTDSKITFKVEAGVASNPRPSRVATPSTKPFWDSLPRTVCLCSQPVVVQRVLNNNCFEGEELNLLADELRQRRIDARERALAIESELRKLWKEKGLVLERESFYLGVQKLLHEPFIDERPPESPRASQRKKEEEQKETPKRVENDSDDSDVPLTRVTSSNDPEDDAEKKKRKLRRSGAIPKKKKKKSDDDESLPEETKADVPKDTNKPLRTQQFWAELDQFFEYPDEESIKALQTTSWSEDEAARIPACGRPKESEEDIIEIGGDEDDAKKLGAPNSSNSKGKKPKKLALKRLCLARSDPKIKKSIMETDRILKGESELLSSLLSQRALSAIIDVPYPTPKPHVQSVLPEAPSEGSPNSPKRGLTKKPSPTTEERLQMELRYLGVLPDDFEEVDELAREDDEICIELRALQQNLRETTSQNNRIKEATYGACALSLGSNKVLKQVKEGYKTCERGYQKIKKKYAGAISGMMVEKKRHQIEKTLANLRAVEHETSCKHLPVFQPHPRDMHGFPRSFWNEYLPSPNPYCSTLEDQPRRSLFDLTPVHPEVT